ncbi:MAG: hypothetical protein DIU67_000350 [Actinomycetes bacterium]|jgi:hypothetical protein|nr:MAG: hypothetical protein DIU67_06495 [Actinomycetota bacterium]
MGTYDGKLRIEGTEEPPINVVVDLTGDHIKVVAGDVEIAEWTKDEIRITDRPDGSFHVLAEGEEIVLDISDDARFAIELGFRGANPYLRRKIGATLRELEQSGGGLS